MYLTIGRGEKSDKQQKKTEHTCRLMQARLARGSSRRSAQPIRRGAALSFRITW